MPYVNRIANIFAVKANSFRIEATESLKEHLRNGVVPPLVDAEWTEVGRALAVERDPALARLLWDLALSFPTHPAVLTAANRVLTDSAAPLRDYAFVYSARGRVGDALTLSTSYLDDPNCAVKFEAARVLAEKDERSAVERFIALLPEAEDHQTREAIEFEICERGDAHDLETLLKLKQKPELADSYKWVSVALAEALENKRAGDSRAEPSQN